MIILVDKGVAERRLLHLVCNVDYLPGILMLRRRIYIVKVRKLLNWNHSLLLLCLMVLNGCLLALIELLTLITSEDVIILDSIWTFKELADTSSLLAPKQNNS